MRAFRILEILSMAEEPLPLAAIVWEDDRSAVKQTVHRLLKQLELARGYGVAHGGQPVLRMLVAACGSSRSMC
ncbi:hypothetical protein ACTMU2_40100 [Cupriavidus basilensis]